MHRPELALRVIIAIAAAVAAVTLLASMTGAVDIHGDIQMYGTQEDKRIDIWGNVTVQASSTLTLRNVTMIFHTDLDEVFGIRMEAGANLLIQDKDDDPSTPDDASLISSTGGAWFLAILDGASFEVRASRLENVGKDHIEPGVGSIYGVWIVCDAVELWESQLLGVDGRATVHSPSVAIEGTTLSNLYLTVNVLGQSLSMTDIYIQSMTMVVTNGRSFILEPSISNDSQLVCNAFNTVRVSGTRFNGSSLNIHSVSWVDIFDCSFQGSDPFSIYGAGDQVSVFGCRFEDSYQGIMVSYTMLTLVAGCTFDNVTYPFRQSSGAIDMRNVTMSGADTGIRLWSGEGTVNISDTICRDSVAGVDIIKWMGPIGLANCSFTNISFAGVDIEETRDLRLRSCSFVNVSQGVTGDLDTRSVWELEVVDSSFELFVIGLNCNGANITAIGNTFDAGHVPDIVQYCIYFGPALHRVNHSLVLTDNVLTDAGTGVYIDPYIDTHTTAAVTRNRFDGCIQGLVAHNLTRVILEGNVFEGCREGITVWDVDHLSVDDLTIANGTDGISIQRTIQVRLGHLDMRHLTGVALRESFVGDPLWSVTGHQVLDGLRIILMGEVLVNGTLRLVDTELTFSITGFSHGGVTVFDGGSLHLEGSSIRGEEQWPYFLTVTDGGTLFVVDSTIAHCGVPHVDNSRTGPYLEGDGHRLEGLKSVDCHKGLVLVNASVELVDCIIRGRGTTGIASIGSNVTATGSVVFGPLTGISAQGSGLTLDGCSVNSSTIALRVDWSVLSLTNSTVQASIRTIWAQSSVLEFIGSTIATEGELVHLYGTELTVHTCVFSPLRAIGGHLEASQILMYDTSHEGPWSPKGEVARVEQFWYHRATVVTRWDGSPVEGAWIDVYDPAHAGGYLVRTRASIDGTTETLWLLQREISDTGEVLHGPYTFLVDDDGVHGESESPGNARWEGIVEIVDLQSPDLSIAWPLNGSVHNVTDIALSGTVHDVGSGLAGLHASIDDGLWYQISTEEGPWEVDIQLLDGPHTIRVRATDADGGETTVGISLTVDTIPPLVVFTSPPRGTTMRSSRVQVVGFVVEDEGTPVSEVHFNGDAVELNDTGHFSVRGQMSEEGPNSFTVVAVDLAGNRGEAILVLHLDRTPPDLLLDDLPDITRKQEVTVRGSAFDPLEVSVSINGNLVAKVRDGTFEATIVLSLGLNELTIEAVDAVGNRVSVLRTVVFDTRVDGTVVYPANGAVLRNTYVMVSIDTDPLTWVRVRDRSEWTLAPENGTMGIWVTLVEGENQLVVDFRDAANNTHVAVVDVVVRPKGDSEGDDASLLPWIGLAAIAGVAMLLLLQRRGVIANRDKHP